ncbi:MAG: putative toxin-antitoxin system toxin component, PIN family [Betaproteobacteria bacterium]|nr:putative toxin-antitoxin system toxin component, PIN family [Betaproteobacteria bacterium]
MLVILDKNVLLSGLRAGRSPPAEILDAWRKGRLGLVTSTEQIEEFRRAVRYPQLASYLPRGSTGRVVNELRSAEVVLERLRRAGDAPDPGDDYLLAMAIAAGADFLFTRDKPLHAVKRVGHARIVRPRRFAAMLARRYFRNRMTATAGSATCTTKSHTPAKPPDCSTIEK